MFFKVAKQGNNQFFLYFVTIVIVFVAAVVGQLPLFGVVMAKAMQSEDPEEVMAVIQESMDFTEIGMDPNVALFLILLSFVAAFFALWFCVAKLHRKPFLSVITARSSLDWSKVFWAFGIWFGLTIVLEVVAYFLDPGNYALQFNWRTFIPLLILSFGMLPLQTSFEEIFFRGYLMQGLGHISAFRWIPLLITSVAFGLMHIANPEVEKFGTALMMTYYISIGLFLGICTLMDDGLELALGVHAATNIYGATIVSFSGSALQTPTIFRVQELDADLMLVVGLVTAAFFIFLAARKYGWKDWTKLYGPVKLAEDPIEEETPIVET